MGFAAVRCSVLQRVAVCYSVLHCVCMCVHVCVQLAMRRIGKAPICEVCCSALQRVAVCCSVLQCVAECVYVCTCVCTVGYAAYRKGPNLWDSISVLQRVAVCCSVLQRVAACCRRIVCLCGLSCIRRLLKQSRYHFIEPEGEGCAIASANFFPRIRKKKPTMMHYCSNLSS